MPNLVTLTVKYTENETSSTVRTLEENVAQSVYWQAGRSNITDTWAGGSCTISGRGTLTYPPSVGGKISVKVDDGTNSATYYGFIRDFSVQYGIIAAEDTWQMTVEGPLARAGRYAATVTTTAATSTFSFATAIDTALSGVVDVKVYGDTPPEVNGWGSTTSAQTYTNKQVTDLVNILITTEQGHVLESGSTVAGAPVPRFDLAGRNDPNIPGPVVATLADDGTGTSYYEIEFQSAAYNYASKVVVSAAGFADQTSGTGSFVQSFDTINGSATEAANIAGWIKTSLDLSNFIPYSVSFKEAAGSLTNVMITQPNFVGQPVTVKFRGSTYQTIIEGMALSARRDGWNAKLYLSSSLQNAWLRLDDTVYGKLDTNRLGL